MSLEARAEWLLQAIRVCEAWADGEAAANRTELAFSSPGDPDHDRAVDGDRVVARALETIAALRAELAALRGLQDRA